VDPSQPGAAVLPPVSRLMDFSETVAAAVAGEARKEGLAGMEFGDPRALVRSAKWTPAY
jgi:malolactic enzyme